MNTSTTAVMPKKIELSQLTMCPAPHEPDVSGYYTEISDEYLCISRSIAIPFFHKQVPPQNVSLSYIVKSYVMHRVRAHFLKCIQSLEK